MKPPTAAAAHAAALANHAAKANAAAQAQAGLNAAINTRQTLVDRAGSGGSVSAAHLLAGEEAIRSAEAQHEIARAIAASAATARDHAQIAALAETGAAIRADYRELLAKAEGEAAAFDAAVQAARDALAALQSTLARIGGLEHRARELTGAIEEAARVNPILAEMHRSVWPQVPRVPGPAGFAELTVQVVRPPRVQTEDPVSLYQRTPLGMTVRSLAA